MKIIKNRKLSSRNYLNNTSNNNNSFINISRSNNNNLNWRKWVNTEELQTQKKSIIMHKQKKVCK